MTSNKNLVLMFNIITQNMINGMTANQKCFVNSFSLLFIVAIIAQTNAAAVKIITGKIKVTIGPDTQIPMIK